MTLTPQDTLRAATALVVRVLEHLSVHDVHSCLEAEYGALTDAQAHEVLELASNAEVTI